MSAVTPADVLLPVADVAWVNILPGIDFRLLFTSGETGRWTVLLRCQAGSSIPPHRHYGAGEYFVVKGLMEYRSGCAREGTYGYEPLGSLHESTTFPEYTELLFTNYGPVAFLNEEGGISSMLDNTVFEQLVTQN
jgi:anti-sigma factor ChrR (cupin superfamily)